MRFSIGLAALILLPAGALSAAAETIPFDSEAWVPLSGTVVEHDGRTCLRGAAALPDIGFRDGVIEFDAWVTGARGYPGVNFRVASPSACEEFYFRPHVPNRPDALQYTPRFNGVSGWQLYNGPGCTAAADIPRERWIHVRLEVLDRRARVFFGDGAEPALVIDDLRHPAAPGGIALNAAPDGTVFFADFSVERTDALDLGRAPNPVFRRGLVAEWELSRPFPAADADMEEYPGERPDLQWRVVPAEASGLLDIARHVPRRPTGEADLVFARTVLDAASAEVRKFTFGYSDYVAVFLNGRLLFTGDSSYRSRDETFSGIVGLFDTLHLPLRPGPNELLFAVVETFGGWGLIGQDNGADFLAPGLARQWSFATGNRLPEAVVFDPVREEFYVSQYFSGGQETLSRLAPDGTLLQRDWATGLSRPTGLLLDGDRLWCVERRNLVEIGLPDGEIVARHAIPEALFPNDVARADDGTLFVSDTRGNRILRFDGTAFTVWLAGEAQTGVNGLLALDGELYFGREDLGLLQAADLRTGAVREVACLGDGANLDGLRPDGRGGLLVSDFRGVLYLVSKRGEVEVLLDTTASGLQAADFEYVPATGLLVVPGLFDNRLTGYAWRP